MSLSGLRMLMGVFPSSGELMHKTILYFPMMQTLSRRVVENHLHLFLKVQNIWECHLPFVCDYSAYCCIHDLTCISSFSISWQAASLRHLGDCRVLSILWTNLSRCQELTAKARSVVLRTTLTTWLRRIPGCPESAVLQIGLPNFNTASNCMLPLLFLPTYINHVFSSIWDIHASPWWLCTSLQECLCSCQRNCYSIKHHTYVWIPEPLCSSHKSPTCMWRIKVLFTSFDQWCNFYILL